MMTNTSTLSTAGYPGADSTDPELGNGDLRVFWLAALIAILAVSAVVFFKMNQPEWRPATVAQTSMPAQASTAGPGTRAANVAGSTGAVVSQ